MQNYSRVLSGMRPTGRLHLGHFHGVIKNWVKLQYEHECYLMIADLHALTTNYQHTEQMQEHIHNMVIDWLACGVDPTEAKIFVQSHVAEHAMLHLLLSMVTPLSWLERIPSYKEQLANPAFRDIDSYGFLGYPLLQSADILLYNAKYVPVGEDQLSHVELTREIARRFNHIYGREVGFEDKAQAIIKKLGSKKAELYEELRIQYQQNGDVDALEKARFLLLDAANLALNEQERLFAFLENKSQVILTEPEALLTTTTKLIGLDGQKMSKSYRNTILLREDIDVIATKVRGMTTDKARVKRTDPGDPAKCPVWQLHEIYSDDKTRDWVQCGCTTAQIGCLDCKQPLIDALQKESQEFIERAKPYQEDINLVDNLLTEGAEQARQVAHETLTTIKEVMHI